LGSVLKNSSAAVRRQNNLYKVVCFCCWCI